MRQKKCPVAVLVSSVGFSSTSSQQFQSPALSSRLARDFRRSPLPHQLRLRPSRQHQIRLRQFTRSLIRVRHRSLLPSSHSVEHSPSSVLLTLSLCLVSLRSSHSIRITFVTSLTADYLPPCGIVSSLIRVDQSDHLVSINSLHSTQLRSELQLRFRQIQFSGQLSQRKITQTFTHSITCY